MFSSECKRLAYEFMTGQLANPAPGAADFSQFCEVKSEGRSLNFMVQFVGGGDSVVTTRSRRVCPNKARTGNLFYSYQIVRPEGIYTTDHWDGSEVRIQGPDGTFSQVNSMAQPPDSSPAVAAGGSRTKHSPVRVKVADEDELTGYPAE